MKKYVESLNRQSEDIFLYLQLIFVDQGENKDIYDRLNPSVEFEYEKYHPCSLSEARNVGLRHADGDYICFPDDDCWYDDDTLKNVISQLHDNPQLDGIVITAKNEDDIKINGFPDNEKWLTYTNHCGGLSISLFLKYDSDIWFDENIGVGSKFNLSSGEETDYLLTYMERHPGFKIKFTPDIVIRHPLAKYEGFESSVDKIYKYARGNGYIIRKHKYSLAYKMLCLMKPCAKSFICYLLLRPEKEMELAFFRGRLEGFFMKI